jgi:hypothetical protein
MQKRYLLLGNEQGIYVDIVGMKRETEIFACRPPTLIAVTLQTHQQRSDILPSVNTASL